MILIICINQISLLNGVYGYHSPKSLTLWDITQLIHTLGSQRDVIPYVSQVVPRHFKSHPGCHIFSIWGVSCFSSTLTNSDVSVGPWHLMIRWMPMDPQQIQQEKKSLIFRWEMVAESYVMCLVEIIITVVIMIVTMNVFIFIYSYSLSLSLSWDHICLETAKEIFCRSVSSIDGTHFAIHIFF